MNLITFTRLFVGDMCRYNYVELLSWIINIYSKVWLNYLLKAEWDVVQLDRQRWGQLRIFKL